MKRILLSVLTIGLVASVAVGATRAYFSNQGTNAGNTFSAGTLDLKLWDSDEGSSYVDDITATWTANNMAPGDSVTGSFYLKNTGTVAGNHIEIDTSNSISDSPWDMDKQLEIVQMKYDQNGNHVFDPGDDILSMIPVGANGYPDLDDLEGITLDNLSLNDLNNYHEFFMEVKLHENTGNDYQGDQVTTTFTITLNQDVSQ